MNESTNGYLVISLDFELLWGVFDVVDFEEKRIYFENTRLVIPKILEGFIKHNVHVTWATVGMLFHKNWEEWERNFSGTLPAYSNSKLSAYEFGKTIKPRDTENLCFAPELIREIAQSPGQEIGTHTYSHYYCLEEGQTLASFKADLEKSIELAKKMGIELKSLVFPRNQLREDYLKVCYELGIINVRSNPSSWYWKDPASDSILTKLARTGDAYFPLGKKSYSIKEVIKNPNLPLEQKAGRFLRPVECNSILHKLKIRRIKMEMTLAAKNNEIYHLWWHPHNFGDNPLQSIQDLKSVLTHFEKLREKFNFQSANMCEIGKLVS
jgi:peptidoglycan/xylan/chitin deacetylase (PgdA/CDA1 family)